MTYDDMMARHELAVQIARDAGAVALQWFQRRETLTVETKASPQDVVSRADREVEELIRARIREKFPEDGILGEEYGLAKGKSGYVWVVDPIDGTSPFVFGMPNWCVSIAVVHDDKIIAGAIHAPVTDDLYETARGAGARLNGKTLRMDPSRNISNAMCGMGANHLADPETNGAMITRLMAHGGTFFRNGSGAMMLAYVAAGRLVAYYEPVMHAWDCLAGYCLIAEAGGWHSPFSLTGEGLLTKQQVCAAGPGAVEEFRAITGV